MEQDLSKLDAILPSYQGKHGVLIPLLQHTQSILGYISRDAMRYLAEKMGIPAAEIFGVATFYAHFALEPKGRYVVRLCDGTACHVKGSIAILDALRERLGLPEGKNTTPDMLFTVETVSCLGACGLAPAVVINEDVHGQMTPDTAVALIDEILQKEGAQ